MEAGRGELREDYRTGRKIGKISLGARCFYLRTPRAVYYIPYGRVTRYFRRVRGVPAALCCARGEFRMEHFVICGEEGELAEVELPGKQAALVLMECMERRAPQALAGKPPEESPAEIADASPALDTPA